MSKIKRRELVYDQELQQQGMRRIYRTEYVTADGTLVPVYREAIVPINEHQSEMTPWWKRTKSRRRKL